MPTDKFYSARRQGKKVKINNKMYCLLPAEADIIIVAQPILKFE
jgi:hypothetical protein